METREPAVQFKPPYMAFQTFWNFVAELAAKPLPPRIDRSLMNSKSGTDQANLVAALKAFELVDEDHVVQPGLIALTDGDETQRLDALKALVRTFYRGALRVSDNHGTEQQLRECFRDEFQLTSADTQRKAITFFLHAARAAGIPLSSHFPQTRGGQGGPGAPKPRRQPRKRAKVEDANGAVGEPATPSSRSQTTVRLRTGGEMTLAVSVDPLALRGSDREFFFKVVDLLLGYEDAAAGQSPTSSAIGDDRSEVATSLDTQKRPSEEGR